MERTEVEDFTPVAQGIPITSTVVKNSFDSNAATTFGVFALLGVEYAINTSLSLAAEYHLGFSSSSQPEMAITNESGVETTYEGGKSTFMGITSVGLLTLAIYLD